MTGHSIECRINAENPRKGFRPSPGTVKDMYLPGGKGIRIDSAIYSGYTIPPYYDSMVAKLIVWAKNRKEAIAKMKDGAILINTSRGPLLAERDVADALNSGKLYAAGVDVAETEPIPADSPLLTAKNCVITPHIAWAPLEARQRLMGIAVGNLRGFLAGSPENVVN